MCQVSFDLWKGKYNLTWQTVGKTYIYIKKKKNHNILKLKPDSKFRTFHFCIKGEERVGKFTGYPNTAITEVWLLEKPLKNTSDVRTHQQFIGGWT